MRISRWVRAAAALAIVAGGVAVSAPAAQAAAPVDPSACYWGQLLNASNHASWGSYDITIAPHLPADVAGAIGDAQESLTSLGGSGCDGLDRYIGADVAAARPLLTAGIAAADKGDFDAASDLWDQADAHILGAMSTLYKEFNPPWTRH